MGRRILASLVLFTLWCPLGLQARAQDEQPAEPRRFEMALPLRDGETYLGDLLARIAADGSSAMVERERLLELIRPVVEPEVLAALAVSLGDAEFVPTVQQPTDDDIALLFDPTTVELRLVMPLADRGVRSIRLGASPPILVSETAEQPAFVSLHANTRIGMDYVHSASGGEPGLQDPTGSLDAALRIGRLVLESEILLNDMAIERSGSRAIIDFPEQVLRLAAGDLNARSGTFAVGSDLLGVSLVRRYADLQPTRGIRPTGSRDLRIARASTVEIYQDGQLNRRIRLEPGNYRLEDITATSGVSDVRVVVVDDSGAREEILFSVFSDLSLLEAGLDEFALHAGVASLIERDGQEYDFDTPILSVDYRRGLGETTTLVSTIEADDAVRQAGLGLIQATPIGVVGVEVGGSQGQGAGGYALRLDYRSLQSPASAWAGQNLRATLELRSNDFRTIGANGEDVSRERRQLALSYGRRLDDRLYGTLSTRYTDDAGQSSYGADLTLNRPIGAAWMASATTSYSQDEDNQEVTFFATVTYRFDYRTMLRGEVDVTNRRARQSFSRGGGGYVGSYDLSIDATQDDGEASLGGDLTYYANRGEVGIRHDAAVIGGLNGEREQRSSLRAATSLAFADGAFAIGRPITNGFALVRPHPNLEDRLVRVGDIPDQPQAFGSARMPAVMPSIQPYTPQRLVFDVDDLPTGYDLGAGVFDLYPPYRAGYNITVGSDYTMTVIGTLFDADGAPVVLRAGRAIELETPERSPVELFTNRSGRFGGQGLRPGVWRIEVDGMPDQAAEIRIPDGEIGLFRTEDVRMVRQ